MNRIVVLGYYYRHNLGDDTFIEAFKKLFGKALPDIPYTVEFHNTDEIKLLPSDTKVLVCGGGDIVNEYFINKIVKLLERSKYNGPIYAIGIGVSGHELINWGFLDFCDHVILRSEKDYGCVSSRLGHEHVNVFPDITCMLSYPGKSDKSTLRTTKRVGIFLARPICNNIDGYNSMIDELAIAFDAISENGFIIRLIPFNTDPKNHKEDDRIINAHVYERMKRKDRCEIMIEKYDFQKMQEEMSNLDLAICMRFHSHVFAAMNGIPFLSLCFSPKVAKFCQELNHNDHTYELDKHPEKGYPTLIESKKVIEQFLSLAKINEKVSESLKNMSMLLSQKSEETSVKVRDLLVRKRKRNEMERTNEIDVEEWFPKKRLTAPFYLFPSKNEQNRLSTCRILIKMISKWNKSLQDKPLEIENLASSLNAGQLNFYNIWSIYYSDQEQEQQELIKLSEKQKKDLAYQIARIICFKITGQSFPPYYYGLAEQIFNSEYNFVDSWNWIAREWLMIKPTHIPKVILDDKLFPLKFDLKTLEQEDFGGVHRSGWQYVVDHMFSINSDDSNIILDTYMDKTFGWYSQFYQQADILPYKKPWIGFIHHTFAENYSSNNAKELLHCELFVKSLHLCKGLFVLSEDLAAKVRRELIFVTDTPPLVNVLFHPTEIPTQSQIWNLSEFLDNSEKKLIQVGAWLRDSYGIYRVPIDKTYKNELGIRKAALKGKHMENYFRPRKSYIVLTNNNDSGVSSTKMALCPCKCSCKANRNAISISDGISPRPYIKLDDLCSSDKESLPNKYMHGLLKCIEEQHSSVELIKRLENDDYDRMMRKNIVFVNLVDCSAANTIIESIVRQTPILVNKIPSVVEYLGEKYPFYYESFREAADKATDLNCIVNAHEYLKNYPVEKLSLKYFWKTFSQSEIYQNLLSEYQK